MKVNSITGITCYVKDLAKAAEFYEALGFRRGKEEPERVTFYVNWFFVTLVAQEREADGQALYIKVDDVEEFHKAVVSKGMKPAGEPEVRPPATGSSCSTTSTGRRARRRGAVIDAPAAGCQRAGREFAPMSLGRPASLKP